MVYFKQIARRAIRKAIGKVWSNPKSIVFDEIDGLDIGEGVTFNGKPIIDIRNGGKITIGNNTTINSENYGYHINMHSHVKFYADRDTSIISIGENTRIHGSCIHAYSSITIGSRCLIAANCQIMDSGGHKLSFDNVENRINTVGDSNPIVIEDCVWLGANTIVLPGVTIGRGSVIGAGSVVARDIPPMVVAAGNPAQIIRNADDILRANT